MKKLGLLSVAAAVALSSSAFAGEVKLSADATVKGESLKIEAASSEASEGYNLEVNLGVEMKNDDGITMKAGWVVFDGLMQDTPATSDNAVTGTATTNPIVAPALDYGYIIAPLGDLTLKSGFVEAGPFGTNFTNSGSSVFKPFALDYKVSGMSIGLEEHMRTESADTNKGGGTIGAAGDDEKSSTRVYVKGKAGDLGWGVRDTMTYTGETSTADAKTDSQIEAFVVGNAAGMNVAAHYVTQSGDSYDTATTGLYAHVLVPMGNLTAGVAVAQLTNGFDSGAEFDPSTLTDVVLNQLSSAEDEATALTVIPVIFKVNDKVTVDARYVTGSLNNATVSAALNSTKIKDERAASAAKSYTEIDANINYALGSATNLKLMYATGSGEAVGDKSIVYTGWSLSTAF
jgi:hypothetical protein